jgi:hypothetical protein
MALSVRAVGSTIPPHNDGEYGAEALECGEDKGRFEA